jgi:hypothetical protein
MSSTLAYSLISDEKNNINLKKKHCRTIRKKDKKKTGKIDKLINSLAVPDNNDTNLLPPPQIASQITSFSDDEDDDSNFNSKNQLPQPASSTDENANPLNHAYNIENFAQMAESASAEDYYKQYVPNYNQIRGSSEQLYTNQDDLLKKLNYMIHLLEEQQDEKTDNVTEELILYLFLGVFVIFVIDSFAKVGKYKR